MTSAKQVMYIKELIKSANELDIKGLYKEADLIDSIMVKIAQGPTASNPQAQGGKAFVRSNDGTNRSTTVAPITPTPDQAGNGLYTKLYYPISMGDTKRYGIANSLLAEFDFSDPTQPPRFIRYIDSQDALPFVDKVIRNPQVWKMNDSLSADRDRDKRVFEEFSNILQREVHSEDEPFKVAPEPPSGTERKQVKIPRGTRGYIDLPGDDRYAYKLGGTGTTSYIAFDRATGRQLGTFNDAAGRAKVEKAIQENATSSLGDPHIS